MTLPQALFFDMDGVIIDTEKDGHRVAFNKAFKDFGYDVTWDVEEYGKLIRISGGKERMKHYLATTGFGQEIAPDAVDEIIRALHKHKTEIFVDLIQSGSLALRPGIHRLMKEANDNNVPICICTTANQKAAQAVVEHSLADVHFAHIFAGDVVARKKPAPDIYLLALEKTAADPKKCIVVEDSRNGMLAGCAAGIKVVVTTSIYTSGEDFTEASIVVSSLGDTEGERGQLSRGTLPDYDGVLSLSMIGTLIR